MRAVGRSTSVEGEPTDPPSRLRRWGGALAQTTTYLGVATIACVWIGVLLLSDESRRRAVDDGAREGSNLTRIFEQYISNLIGGADSALLVLRDAYERRPEGFDIRRWIERAKLQNDLIMQFAVVGPDGILRHTSIESGTSAVDIHDRDYFRAQADSTVDELLVSKPVVGRLSGRSLVQLVRKIRTPDGTFGGIIFASLDILLLEKFYNSIDVGPGGVVSLTGLDGVIRARSGPRSAAKELIGKSVPYAKFLDPHRSAQVGSYWNSPGAERQLDGIRRLISYRVIEGLPLVAVVGMAESDVFAQAEAEASNYRRIGLALTAFVLAAIGFGAARQMRIVTASGALEQSRLSLARTNSRFDTALNNISQGLCMFDASARLSICNRRYIDMYRLSPEIVKPGCSLRELMQHRKELGILIGDVEQHCRDILDNLVHGTSKPRHVEAPDGRIIRALNHPIPGGGWVSMHQDITEQHLAERRLEEANRQLTTQQWAIDQSLMVSMTDASGQIVYVNENFCRVSGYGKDELLGKSHRILRSGVHSDQFYGEMYRQIGRGEAWRGEMCNKAADGSFYWADTTIVPRPGADGEPSAYMAIRIDITARKQAESQIAYMARHDPLTGLVNRAVFLEEIERALVSRRGGGPSFAVMLIDLDHFKDVNDMLGHASGDALLEIVAERLREHVRATDVVARLGGDEFALLAVDEGDARENALILANSLLATIRATYDLDGHEAVIGASIGIAVVEDDTETAGQLLKSADIALYKVKSEGRDGICFFDGALEHEAHSRAQLVVDLWKAIQRGEFELYYQPIVDLAKREICGMEALVRWHHPSRGLVMPADFIPVAEASGAITMLGDWILRRACSDAAAWPPHVKVSVNLSPAQFRKGGLVDAVTGALTDSAAIVCAVVGLARSLDMGTTAEGVESVEQLDLLRVAGCRQGQGYLFARPRPVAELEFGIGNASEEAA